MSGPRLAFFGSSLVSSYWNGAATYYRGLIRALHARGWQVTFFEPDAYGRQAHRDMPDPDWARVVVYPADDDAALRRWLDRLADYDILVKASGVGVFDELLEDAIPTVRRGHQTAVYWDVDAPATAARLAASPGDPLRAQLPRYDQVILYGGGPPIVAAFRALGARACDVVYNAVDPEVHHPVPPELRLAGDVALLANRLPDREARIEEFFLGPAARCPRARFVLGGNGWADRPLPDNVLWLGHVPTADHNTFNCSSRIVLSVNRADMARAGYAPATRMFEAAGAGACLLSDAWAGLDTFFEPGVEILTAATGEDVMAAAEGIDEAATRRIGAAARRRVLAEHTYARRAQAVDALLAVGSRS